MTDARPINLLIASWLEPEHVERIRSVDSRVRVTHEPSLLRRPRYIADHNGFPGPRAPEDEARWRALLAEADVLFDFDYTNDADLPELAPRLKWIQATSAGIGQFVVRRNYHTRMPNTTFTSAKGIHAIPLAEFCLMSMLGASRGLALTIGLQAQRKWERFATTDLVGRTVVIFGYGSIGREVGRLSRAFGMNVIGIKRTVTDEDRSDPHANEVLTADAFTSMLPRADFLVLCAPHTDQTESVLGRAQIASMKKGAYLINIGRGALVDEPALIDALRSGHVGGAALDVFATEPLPPQSPFWTMPNVLVVPHSASTSDRENGRITDLFCENIRRFLAGRELLNVLDVKRLY